MTQWSTQSSVVLLPAAPSDSAEFRRILADLAELSKLRITVMVAITAFVGFLLGRAAMPAPAAPGWLTLAATLIGTSWSCIGASVFNQVYERDTDALMRRTRHRPVAAGRISPAQALWFGSAAALLGVITLAVLTTPLAAVVSAFTIWSYTLVYTPMKRVSSASTIVGAVPGALPPVIGYAAATGTIGLPAVALFAIMFLWQLPHFYAIAWMYRDQYAAAGFPMLPVLDPTGRSTFAQALLHCVLLVPVSLLPTLVGISGWLYFAGALVCSLTFMSLAVVLVFKRSRAWARILFFASLIYLPAVLVLMFVDRV